MKVNSFPFEPLFITMPFDLILSRNSVIVVTQSGECDQLLETILARPQYSNKDRITISEAKSEQICISLNQKSHDL
jgi:hypothetical protein